MITFNKFQFKENTKLIDITIPSSSIVYLENCNSNIFVEKPFSGEILFKSFPIQHGMKSFLNNIFFYFSTEILFEKLSIERNMKKYSSMFDCGMIWNVPITYFKIDEKLLKEKIKNIDTQTKFSTCYGLMLFFRDSVCMVNVANEIDEKNSEILKNLILSRANYGMDIVFYCGKKLNIEKEIVINL